MHERNHNPGDGVLEVNQVLECKQLFGRGVPIREISRKLEVSRNTVRRYVRGVGKPGAYQMENPRSQPVRDLVRERIREFLETERSKSTPRKQVLTGARIHRLLERDGVQVGVSTVRRVVREVRVEMRDALKHAYLPLEYEPGEDAQVDFFEGVADDAKLGRIKVHVLLVRACFSGRCFAYAAPNQTREALLEGLMRAFEHFGGVFRKLWFDNLTPVVRKVLKGRTRELQRAFEVFQAHYGFEAEFCAPGKGNEKGGVEGEVKYSRHEILSPIPDINGRDDLQVLCGEWMERDVLRRMSGREQTIGQMWSLEVGQLMDLPSSRFEVAAARTATVSNRSWIQHGTNFYSVPVEWVGRVLPLKVEAERVVVLGPNGEQVEHRRLYGQHEMSLKLDHYLPLLKRKHRGIDRAVPMRRFLEQEDPCWRVLLTELRRLEGEIDGSKAFVEVLLLCREYDTCAVASAVQQTLRREAVSLGLVRFYLRREIEATDERPEEIDYPGPAVLQGSASDYADLMPSTEVCCG